jgi:hypothetical protein
MKNKSVAKVVAKVMAKVAPKKGYSPDEEIADQTKKAPKSLKVKCK